MENLRVCGRTGVTQRRDSRFLYEGPLAPRTGGLDYCLISAASRCRSDVLLAVGRARHLVKSAVERENRAARGVPTGIRLSCGAVLGR